jgi:hypothetical protein
MPRKGSIGSPIAPALTVTPYAPPPAPADFSQAEAKLWADVFASMREIAPSAYPLARAYCTTVVGMDQAAEEIRKCDPEEKRKLEHLYKQHRELLRSVCALATRLRLCPSSRTRKDPVRPNLHVQKPWQGFDGEPA